MTDPEKCDYIAIGLPMPVSIFGALGDLIDKAWPGAAIITNPEAAGVPTDVRRRIGYSRDVALLQIPRKVAKRVTKKAAAEIVATHAPAAAAEDLDFLGMDDEWVRMAPPEELCLFIGGIGKRVLDGFEDAVNYVEWEVTDKESRQRCVLSFARSKGQTPAALRTKAEKELADARDKMRALADALARGVADVHAAEEELRALAGERA